MSHSTPTGAWAHFLRHVPRRPYATNDPRRGIEVHSKIEALECSHVQAQGVIRGAVLLDLDHGDSLTRLMEEGYPPPNLVMEKPENGHAHAVWQLRQGVTCTATARKGPQKALRDLARQLTLLYGADEAYSGFLVKTPHHPRWRTHELAPAPYGLAELLDAVPAGIAAQARERQERRAEGEGRHQTIFHTGRLWAYGQVRRARTGGDYGAWEATVLREFTMLNTFAQPLPLSELRSLARSVARWTWERADRLTGAVLPGEKRSLQRSWERAELSEEGRKARMLEAAERTNAVRRNATFDAITSAIATLAGQGNHRPTNAQIASLAGVSTRTVQNFRASDRSGMQAVGSPN